MNFAAFGIDSIDISDRLSFTSTIALTLVALKFALENTSMPTCSQSNWIQKYNILCILLTLALMVLFAVGNGDQMIAVIVSSIVFFMCNLFFFFVAYHRHTRKFNSEKPLTGKIPESLSVENDKLDQITKQ